MWRMYQTLRCAISSNYRRRYNWRHGILFTLYDPRDTRCRSLPASEHALNNNDCAIWDDPRHSAPNI